jgi:hypothetical protein
MLISVLTPSQDLIGGVLDRLIFQRRKPEHFISRLRLITPKNYH